jgi:hypothetical protein
MSRRRLVINYLLGLSCTFLGAWGLEVTGSMLPLALGAAATIMQTVSTVTATIMQTVSTVTTVWRRRT